MGSRRNSSPDYSSNLRRRELGSPVPMGRRMRPINSTGHMSSPSAPERHDTVKEGSENRGENENPKKDLKSEWNDEDWF